MWMRPASCSGVRTSLVSGWWMPNATPMTRAAAGSGSARSTAAIRRACTHATLRGSDGPPDVSTNTCGDDAIPSTPSRSRVASESGPGRRSSGRSPVASISTASPGDSAGINGPLTRTPPVTARSMSASDRRVASTMAEEPPPGSALRTVPSTTRGRAPKFPSMEPGPGVATAVAPRSMPSPAAAPTISTAATHLADSAAARSAPPATTIAHETTTAGEHDAAKAPPQPSANPPQVTPAQRPAREPASRFTAPGGRRAGSARGRRRWRSRRPGRRGAGSWT